MISRSKIKFLKSLSIKKYRYQHNSVILEGRRLIEESISLNADIKNVWFTDDAFQLNTNQKLITCIKNSKIPYDIISNRDLKYLSDTQNNQGIIAETNFNIGDQKKISKIHNIVILDSIADPGNLGTILRTCAWYGIKSIILTENTSDPYNLKCLRSALGAHFYFQGIFKMSNQNILDFISNNKYYMLCADLNGESINSIKIQNKWAVIFGSESDGIHYDFKTFPKLSIGKLGSMESLNVSVACGIILDQLLFTRVLKKY